MNGTQKPEIKTPADLVAFIQQWGTAHILALNGIIDKLPEGVRAEWQAMKDKLDAMLSKLKPTDQVPAALDASYALNSFAGTVASMLDYADSLRERLKLLAADLVDKTTALNGFEQKIKDGQLLTKAMVDAAIATAKNEATAALMPSIVSIRKGMIATCGLPEAEDGILNLPQADFDARLTQAKTNLTAMTGKGFALNGRGAAFVKATVWKDATAFNGAMEQIADLVGKPGAPEGDPLLGGGTASVASASDAPKPFVVA